MENISYSYKVKKVDLDLCQIQVEYIPDNILLKPLELTLSVDLDELLTYDLQSNIERVAPIQKWQATLYLMDNYNNIVNTSGTSGV